ncbi:MFS transporter [Oryzihumus sp.]|uniref:MFS transporter n=1 Tax=Oryzihumus sp. TaxID=1968903 RepID=UPI002EDAAF81
MHTPVKGSVPAVVAVFTVNGALMAQAYARMPQLRDQVGATPAQLGLALLGGGLGSVLAMPWTGRVVERWGSKATIRVVALVNVLAWATVAWTGSPLALAATLVFIGATTGVWDVAMNVQGHHVERLRGRSLMPRLHAGFSAGTLAGALVGALAAKLTLPLQVQLPVFGALTFVVVIGATRLFVGDHVGVEVSPEEEPVAPTRSGITVLEVLIGLITLSTAIGEGAANDWLALLLVDVREAPPAFGALTFAAFNLTMLLGRLAGGPAIERFGRVWVLRVSGLCACAGVLLVCLVPMLGAAVLGGLLWGLGLATVFPATMSAAGEVPGRGQRAIGVVSTIGYGGFLLGAPTIGLLTSHVGLDRALLLIAGFAALIVVLARYAAPVPATSHVVHEPDVGPMR